MLLKRVRIENYRSIKEADFNPTALCALIGSNNCGKSNILKAINLVLGSSWPSTRSVDSKDFFGYDESKDVVISLWFDQALEVSGEVGEPVQFTGIQFKVTHYKRASGKNRKGDLKTEFVCIGDDGQPVKVLRRFGASPRPALAPANVDSATRDALPAVMVDVDRDAAYHLSGNQYSILGRMLREISKTLKADVTQFADFQQKFDAARQVLRTTDFMQLQTELIHQVRSHTGLAGIDIQLDAIDPLNLYRNFSVLFKDPETPEPVDAERMGSGIQSALVISLLQAYRVLHKDNAILLF
jgi:putative ATP-dependent endonuclease of OLD family